MTVNTTNIISGPYNGNDVTDTFSYTFRIENKNQVTVFETDAAGVVTTLVVDTDYTVNGVGDDAGGTITRAAGALPTGSTWYIRSNYTATQLTEFTSQGAFFPEIHETAMDKLTFLIQQLYDSVSRTIRLADSSLATAPVLDDPEPLKFLRINAAGTGVDYVSGTLDTLATQVEVQVLTDGQTAVQFTNATTFAAFYIAGDEVDRGRLELGVDFTVDHVLKTITLNQSYPSGTKIIMVYYEGEALINNGDSDIFTFSNVAVMKTASLASGQLARTRGYYNEDDEGHAVYLVQTAAEYSGTPDELGDHTLANGNIAVLQHYGTVSVRQFGAFHDILAINDKANATDQSQFFEAASVYADNLKIIVPAGGYKVDTATTGLAFWQVEPGAEIRKTGTDFARVGLYRDLSNLSGAVRQWCKRPTGGTGTALNGSSGYRVGAGEPYESNILGHDAIAPLSGIGRNGSSGVFSVGQSGQNTDAPGTVKQQVGAELYGLQDNTANTSNSMTAAYVEVTKAPSTGRAISLEVTTKNFAGDSPDITAVSDLGQATDAATTISLHTSVGPNDLGAGSVDTSGWVSPTPGKVTYGIGFIGRPLDLANVPGWQKGIIFFEGSITGTDKIAMEMFQDYQLSWRSEGGILEGRSGVNYRRFVFGNDATATNSSEVVFWRYRGDALTKTTTLTNDVLGRHSYHGHKAGAGTSGFSGGSTNAIATTEAVQDGATSGANAAGKYSVRVNDGAGAYTGFDFLPARLRPTGDGVMDLGSGANRMNTIYAAVGTINTSDEREKEDIEALSDVELQVAGTLRYMIRKYRLKSDRSKIHVGIIAQEVIKVFALHGLNAHDYGIIHHDEESDRYGVNYSELLAFIIAAI